MGEFKVKKRSYQHNDTEQEERYDAIELIESGEIDEKHFQNGAAQQHQYQSPENRAAFENA